jgi:four helix bundle protein
LAVRFVTRRIEELVVWQLADDLRGRVHAMTATGPAFADVRFRNRVRDATGSINRNIVEGFVRYGHKEFAQFLSIARTSVFELSEHLRDGVQRGYWSDESMVEAGNLCQRTIAAITHFIQHVKQHPDI